VGTPCNGSPEKIEGPIYFEKEVKIIQLAKVSGYSRTTVSSLQIIFIPPDPTVIVNGLTDNSALIYLGVNDETRMIKVNPRGLISLHSGEASLPVCTCWWIIDSYNDDACPDDPDSNWYQDRADFYWFCDPTPCCADPPKCTGGNCCEGVAPETDPICDYVDGPGGAVSNDCEYWICHGGGVL